MAHCASLGKIADLDHPGKVARNFDLFLRLMEDPESGRRWPAGLFQRSPESPPAQ